MSDNHQLIAALARERHGARYDDRVVRLTAGWRGDQRHRAGDRRRRSSVRARAGWLLVGIGLRLAVSDRGAPKPAMLGR